MTATILLLLGGCHSVVIAPAIPAYVPESFNKASSPAPDAPTIEAKWWRQFDDPRLDRLIDMAAVDNLSLRASWYKLLQARHSAAKAGAGFIPTLINDGIARRQVSKAGGNDRNYLNTFGLGLAASYEVDLWGRVAATADAAGLDALAAEQDLLTTTISISGEIAETWYKLRKLCGELALLESQRKTNAELLDIITLQFQRGLNEAADVLQQQQLLEAIHGEMATTRTDLNAARNALAVLVGVAPSNFELDEIPTDLPVLAAQPNPGLPADLLNRRPDVKAAWLKVRAADQRLAAAIADRFPKISITARAETTDQKVRDLFDNWLANLAANLAAPIIDGGSRRAEVRIKRAAAAESFVNYSQKVLDALQEVRDAQMRESGQQNYLQSLEAQLDLSEDSMQRIRESYLKGGTDFTRLLNSQLSHQKLQRTILAERLKLITYRISLCRALAGGWQPSAPTEIPDRVTGPAFGLLDASSSDDTAATDQ